MCVLRSRCPCTSASKFHRQTHGLLLHFSLHIPLPNWSTWCLSLQGHMQVGSSWPPVPPLAPPPLVPHQLFLPPLEHEGEPVSFQLQVLWWFCRAPAHESTTLRETVGAADETKSWAVADVAVWRAADTPVQPVLLKQHKIPIMHHTHTAEERKSQW